MLCNTFAPKGNVVAHRESVLARHPLQTINSVGLETVGTTRIRQTVDLPMWASRCCEHSNNFVRLRWSFRKKCQNTSVRTSVRLCCSAPLATTRSVSMVIDPEDSDAVLVRTLNVYQNVWATATATLQPYWFMADTCHAKCWRVKVHQLQEVVPGLWYDEDTCNLNWT